MTQVMEILYRRRKQWPFVELVHALDSGSTFIMKKKHHNQVVMLLRFDVYVIAIISFWDLACDHLKQDHMD